MSDLSTNTKIAVDTISLSTVVATVAGWLPALAALFSIIWTALRIYETKTVQGWLNRNRTGPDCEVCKYGESGRGDQD